MSKEDPGRLFNKMAKFVRNPLKDWSDIDHKQPEAEAAAPEAGYTREMLREMIERRQRNDFVRRREFELLRKLRQREAAGGNSDDPAQGSSFNINSTTNGKSHGRAVTLRKIDEIEEQMSQQWWKNRNPNADPGADPQIDAEVLADKQRRAYADTTPGVIPGGAQAPAQAFGAPTTVPAATPTAEEGLEEAAVRFAQGDDAGAETILLQVVAPDSPDAASIDAWLTLLDFYRATGDAEKFAAASTRYAQRMHRQGPEWLSLRAVAHGARAAAPPPGPGAGIVADWRSEPQLTREGLLALTRALSSAGAVWTLDWRALESIAPEAAAPLRVLFSHWAGSQVELRFFGDARLSQVMERATPTAERGVDELWWRLRMAALRLTNQVDAFELVALNYCITYEVSPPPWEDPVCRYRSLDPVAAPGPAFSLRSQDSVLPGNDFGALVGDLSGETGSGSASVWPRLDAEAGEDEAPVISCAALVRMDFTAASELMTWAAAQEARGRKVHFKDLHRLMAVFFRLVGIDRHAQISIRTR